MEEKLFAEIDSKKRTQRLIGIVFIIISFFLFLRVQRRTGVCIGLTCWIEMFFIFLAIVFFLVGLTRLGFKLLAGIAGLIMGAIIGYVVSFFLGQFFWFKLRMGEVGLIPFYLFQFILTISGAIIGWRYNWRQSSKKKDSSKEGD